MRLRLRTLAIGSWVYRDCVGGLPVYVFLQRDHLKSENKLESLVSRESSFLFNNLILLAACFTVLWGTLFPVLSEYVQGTKVTVGAPFYNRVNMPIGLFLLFLTGIGPLLAWRSTSLRSIRRNFILPCIAMGVTCWCRLLAFVRGRPARHAGDAVFAGGLYDGGRRHYGYYGGVPARRSVVTTQTGKNLLASMVQLMRRNTRRYGGYIVHFGIVVIFIGIAGGASTRHEQEMKFSETLTMGQYRFVCQSLRRIRSRSSIPSMRCWMFIKRR